MQHHVRESVPCSLWGTSRPRRSCGEPLAGPPTGKSCSPCCTTQHKQRSEQGNVHQTCAWTCMQMDFIAPSSRCILPFLHTTHNTWRETERGLEGHFKCGWLALRTNQRFVHSNASGWIERMDRSPFLMGVSSRPTSNTHSHLSERGSAAFGERSSDEHSTSHHITSHHEGD